MSKQRNIVIGVSWPYANNNLHLGYIASSLSGDILARYHRAVGDKVLLVSGVDTHGTKPELKAKAEGCTPKDIVDRYAENFREALKAFHFSFDKFGITYDPYHEKKCQEMFEKMYQNGYIYENVVKRPYCPTCGKFMADTELQFKCPVCGKLSKADNCDCGYVPTEKDLENATCLVCGTKTVQKEQRVLVFKLTAFKDLLEEMVRKNENIWRANSINETKKYLSDLRDRDFSRDLKWGIPITIKGFEDKTVWVWWEALLGYVTDTMKLGEEQGFDWRAFWKTDVEPDVEKKIYMCHAKDNIPFHSMFLPAMLEALNDHFITNNIMVSAEYLLIDGEKISKSSNTPCEALVYAQTYNTDSLRYYFAINGPEKKDANFTLELYKTIHNNEVVNKFGNLINRTLKFKGLTMLPKGKIDKTLQEKVQQTYKNVGKLIEALEFKKAALAVMDLVAETNKYYDEQQPWVKAKQEDKQPFFNVIASCAYVIGNLSNLFAPFMPATCEKLKTFLQLPKDVTWQEIFVQDGIDVSNIEPLFTRVV